MITKIVLILLCSSTSWSHSGRTNASGCHNDRKNGGYHCHNSNTESRSISSEKNHQVSNNQKSNDTCEFLSQSGAVVYTYCPVDTKPEEIAQFVNTTKDKHKVGVAVEYALYSDKSKAPRNAREVTNLSDKVFNKISMGFINYNWSTKYKKYQCKYPKEKNLKDCSEMLTW